MRKIYFILLLVAKIVAEPFTGFNAALLIGGQYNIGKHKYVDTTGKIGNLNLKKKSIDCGLVLGYLKQQTRSKIIFGFDILLKPEFASVKNKLQATGGSVDGNFSIQPKYLISPNIVLGLVLKPKIMIYAKVGYGFMSTQFNYTDLANGENPNFNKYHKMLNGLNAQIGFDYLLNHGIITGICYNLFNSMQANLRTVQQPVGGVSRKLAYRLVQHSICLKLGKIF